MVSAEAWAVVDCYGTNILQNTISETRRAAIINWLVTVGGVWVRNTTTDQEIEDLWEKRPAHTQVLPITVSLSDV
jgi:hypothetical protein